MYDSEPPQGLDLRRRRRGIYLLPNLFTTAALFAGFFAIVQAMNSKYTLAAISIFIAMVLDGLDGRVARLTRTQSAFGAEYDSLSDMVSFGAAPALIVYEWALRDLGRWGWIASFLYCACAALRLARFNTQLDVADKRYFTGLPSPAAAALLAGFVWIMDDYEVIGRNIDWLVLCVTVFAALSMVSNVKFYSFKDLNLRRSVPFWAVLVVVLLFVVITIDQVRVLFGIFLAYSLSGYVMWLMQRVRGEPAAKAESPPVESQSDESSL
jgi:CDP-diacylglycerol---serine O-phosphatidyltransferase